MLIGPSPWERLAPLRLVAFPPDAQRWAMPEFWPHGLITALARSIGFPIGHPQVPGPPSYGNRRRAIRFRLPDRYIFNCKVAIPWTTANIWVNVFFWRTLFGCNKLQAPAVPLPSFALRPDIHRLLLNLCCIRLLAGFSWMNARADKIRSTLFVILLVVIPPTPKAASRTDYFCSFGCRIGTQKCNKLNPLSGDNAPRTKSFDFRFIACANMTGFQNCYFARNSILWLRTGHFHSRNPPKNKKSRRMCFAPSGGFYVFYWNLVSWIIYKTLCSAKNAPRRVAWEPATTEQKCFSLRLIAWRYWGYYMLEN